jgi:DnaJ-class molecular chaperone
MCNPPVPYPEGVPPPAVVTFTTRQIPVGCAVCGGSGRRVVFGVDGPCAPCSGKGWLWVTETTTTRLE